MHLLRTGLASAIICGALLLTGCPDKTPDTAPDSGTAQTPEAPKTPPPTQFTLSYLATEAGFTQVSLEPGEKPLIEQTSTLELRTTQGLRNYRVRLFDEAERAMVSDDTAEESDSGLVYVIKLPHPLKTGFQYTLVVDAQTGTSFTDTLGRDVEELRATFQVAGEKEKPAPPAPPAKKKKRK